MGKFNSRVVVAYQKCVFLKNIGNYYSLKINLKKYCQLCIDYRSNKFILKNFFKKFEVLIVPVAIENLLYLTPSQAKA